MSFIQNSPQDVSNTVLLSRPASPQPRREMAERLPAAVQPFLTWLTAKPRAGEAVVERPGWHYAALAAAQVLAGVALGALCLGAQMPRWAALVGVPLGWLLTSSGLGLLQVVVFHHCSHGTVFAAREWNILAGRLTSALLLFKHFDIYKREHMLHHSANKLLTDEDEFADFVFGTCGLVGGVSRRRLWLRVVGHLVSPAFHARFAWRRARAAMRSPDPMHNLLALTAWLFVLGSATHAGCLGIVLVVWVLPATVLLQVATVFRILCEHCFPDEAIIVARGRDLPHHATSGVFPGRCPPPRHLAAAPRLAGWALWWLEMLSWQMFVRLFVMVGDAPCHDFHHRRPASRKWTSYIQARESDRARVQAAADTEYNECWGLLQAVDRTLASLAAKPPGFRV
jgi:fatty acid desaturase